MIKNKPFIIGEIGINHNGDLDLTRKLIENSKKANFDAVKFQTFQIKYTSCYGIRYTF